MQKKAERKKNLKIKLCEIDIVIDIVIVIVIENVCRERSIDLNKTEGQTNITYGIYKQGRVL